jgi:hypothetical protein
VGRETLKLIDEEKVRKEGWRKEKEVWEDREVKNIDEEGEGRIWSLWNRNWV